MPDSHACGSRSSSLRGRRSKGREGEVEFEREAGRDPVGDPNDRASRSNPTSSSLPFVRRCHSGFGPPRGFGPPGPNPLADTDPPDQIR